MANAVRRNAEEGMKGWVVLDRVVRCCSLWKIQLVTDLNDVKMPIM